MSTLEAYTGLGTGDVRIHTDVEAFKESFHSEAPGEALPMTGKPMELGSAE